MRILMGFDRDSDTLRVQVIDSGKGITPEEVPLLCEKFGKLFRTAAMNSEGIGLGLMISK